MIDWRPVPLPGDLRRAMEPGTKAYQADAENGGHLTAFVSRSLDAGWHVSISHRWGILGPGGRPIPGRYPTWDEIKDARYRFVPDAVTMALYLPPRAEYVNIMDTCFQLFEFRDPLNRGLSHDSERLDRRYRAAIRGRFASHAG